MRTKTYLAHGFVSIVGASAALASPDYGPAVDRMITGCSKWWSSGYGHKFAVVHTMQGYYLTGIGWMRSCANTTSAHYAVCSDGDDAPAGEISQMVYESLYAWHAVCWNQHSLGVEHEGFVSNPAWYTEPMYQASAGLFAHFADAHGFPKDRNHIVGHNEKSSSAWCSYASANLGINPYCNTHTDPGPYWDWSHYMNLVNGGTALVDNSVYVGQSVPDGTTFPPNHSFTCTFTFQNTGTTTWIANGTDGYTLNWKEGDSIGAGLYNPISGNVGPGGNAVIPVSFTTPATPGSYQAWFRMNNSSGYDFGDWCYLQLYVADPVPTITTQPVSITRDPGQTATFTVVATGATGYQWKKNGVDVSGATSATLTISNAQLSDAGFYTVVVSNGAGSVTSSQAQLVVTATAVAVGAGGGLQGQYFDNQDLTSPKLTRTDATINFEWGEGSPDASVAADTFSVRWTGQVQPRYSQTYTFYTRTDDGVRLWVNGVLLVDKWVDQSPTEWSGALALTAGQFYDIQMEYYENGGGATAQLSWSSASELKAIIPQTQLYVSSVPLISGQPQSQTVTAGYGATFSVTAGGAPPLAYQWQKDNVPLAGATTSSLTLANVQSADQGTYTVVVTNSFGSVVSSGAVLTVLNTPPAITAQPQSGTVLAGATATFSVTATGAIPLAYQWQFNGVDLPGATQSTLTRNNVAPADAGTYRVVVTNQFGSLTSAGAVLIVQALPLITAQPLGQTVAAGANVSFTVTATGSQPLSYQWRRNGVNISGATASSYARNNVQTADVGLYSVVVANSYGSITSAEASLSLTAAIAFQDNFESGMGQWTVVGSGTPLDSSTEQNHTSGGGASAKQDNTTDYMYSNFGSYSGHTKVSYYWYDDGASTKSYIEIRSYSGGSYPGTLTQVLALGKYNSVGANTGEIYDNTKYQLRVLYPSATYGWMNCGGTRGAGWHKFSIERRADGTTLDFAVDDVLARTITGVTAADWNTVMIGTSSSGNFGITAYFDDIVVEYFDPPLITVEPIGQSTTAGGSVTFSVTAVQNPQTYQWRLNGENIPGATTSSLTVNNAQATDAGSYTVAVANGVGPTISAAAVLEVTPPIVLTVAGIGASNKTYDGNTTATLTGTPGTLVGVVGGDTVTLEGAAVGTFGDKNVGAGKTVTVSGQTLGGADAWKYTLTEPTTTADITAKELTVTGIAANNKVYDGTTTATLIGAPGTLDGVVGGDTVTLDGATVGTFADKNVGTGKTVTVSGQTLGGADAGNYTLTEPTATADITGAGTTTALVSSENPSEPGSNVTFTVTVSSGVETPMGEVVFLANAVPFSTNVLVGGVATASTTALPLGTNAVAAQYAAQGNFLASDDTLDQVVKVLVTCSQTNAIVGIADNLDGTFTLTFIGTPQAQYYVVANSAAVAPMSNWLPLAGSTNTVTNTSGLWQVTVTNTAAQQYYRSTAVVPCP